MKGDFSKRTFDPKKHFHNVLMQQGRVLLDTDWNEQAEITSHRNEIEVKDIVGDSGAPMVNAGFKIESFTASPPASPPAGEIQISAGDYYVEGILCQNEADIFYEDQLDYPAHNLPVDPGNYLFFLDVWLRHITVLEDKSLREVALGGPDTTTRSKIVWQVKCAEIAGTSPISPPDCPGVIFPGETAASTGTLSARSELALGLDNSCGLTAVGGYRRLQNQLYRVEIHRTGNRKNATFKWSRDNGSVAIRWQGQDTGNPTELKVSSLGKDELLGFNSGDWIEIIDDTTDLLNKPGILAKLSKPPENNILTIDATTIKDPGNASATSVSISKSVNPRIRRWDSKGESSTLITTVDGWIELEDGVQVKFGDGESLSGSFTTGDYWLIPARTSIADVEWPKDNDVGNTPKALSPFGIHHHYAKLAIANFDTTKGWSIISDCRNLFPALTGLTSLFYVGGDGQEAMPGNQLPEPLMVGVANGSWAVSGAKVKFEILPGGGSLDAPSDGIVTTGVDGIAKCKWTLDPANPGSQVRASLLDAAGDVIPQRLPVIFSASFDVTGTPNSKRCSFTVGRGGDFDTLEIAIEKTRDQRNICLCLLPQTHKIANIKIEDKEFIKISGCGSLVIAEGNEFIISAQTAVLQGLNITAVNEKASIHLQVNEVYADNCTFTSVDSEFYLRTPFILIDALHQEGGDHIQPNALIHWNANNIFIGKESNGIGLALAQNISGWLEDNIIKGDTLLLYTRNFNDLRWPELNSSARINFQNKINLKIKNSLFLHVNRNFLRSIRTNTRKIMEEVFGDPLIDPNNPPAPDFSPLEPVFYKSLFICHNTFESNENRAVNSFLGDVVSINNNHFLNLDIRSKVIAFALGQRGIIMGNIDPLFNGESSLFIDTLFSNSRKFISPNLIVVK